MDRPSLLYLTRRTPDADAGFRQAVDLARSLDASMTLLHVHRGFGPPPGPGRPPVLERLVEAASEQGVEVELRLLGRTGRWVEELNELRWDRWELAVKVPEAEGALRRRLGATLDQRLARAPRVPVWFVPVSRGARVRMVVAGVRASADDPDPLDQAVVRGAAALASAEGAKVGVVHAWSLVGESILACPVRGVGRVRVRRVVRALRRERRARLRELTEEAGGPSATPVVVRGLPEAGLRRAARSLGADLVVLGTLRRDGLEGTLLGNLAERFLDPDGPGLLLLKPGGPVPRFVGPGVAA